MTKNPGRTLPDIRKNTEFLYGKAPMNGRPKCKNSEIVKGDACGPPITSGEIRAVIFIFALFLTSIFGL